MELKLALVALLIFVFSLLSFSPTNPDSAASLYRQQPVIELNDEQSAELDDVFSDAEQSCAASVTAADFHACMESLQEDIDDSFVDALSDNPPATAAADAEQSSAGMNDIAKPPYQKSQLQARTDISEDTASGLPSKHRPT
jgi:hypothetical protein